MSRFIKRQDCNSQDVQYLMAQGINSQLACAMSSRGVTVDNAQQYIGGELVWHDPLLMPNMEQAIDNIQQVVASGGSILIYGDYDADGLSASSLLSLYFASIGVDNDVIVPTREIGYGLNVDLVLQQFEHKWYDLLVTVDCGISNIQEILQLAEHFEGSVDIIVTDHHELPLVLPQCICINPKMGYPMPNLSGSGVAYKLVEGLAGREVAQQYLDLAMIGTVGDIMPLVDENRSIVAMGLKNCRHKGLLQLAQKTRCSKELTTKDLAMRIVPCINACGRMGSPMLALQLLLCNAKSDINLVQQLIDINNSRRDLTEQMYLEAVQQCMQTNALDNKLAFVFDDNWSHGILGIVASRLKESYGIVSLVMTRDGDSYVGSARSIADVNLYELFQSSSQYLIKFGGHKASVGFSVSIDNLSVLQQHLISKLSDIPIDKGAMLYDIDLDDAPFSDCYNAGKIMQPMHPHGELLYRIKDRVVEVRQFGKDNVHIEMVLSNGLSVTAFSKYGQFYNALRCGAEVDMLCTLNMDSYSGNVAGHLVDLVLCNWIHYDGLYRYNYISQLPTSSVDVKWIDMDSAIANIGKDTLILVDSQHQLNILSQHLDIHDYEIDFFYKTSSSGGIVVSLSDNNLLQKYNNIIAFVSNGNLPRTYSYSTKYCLLQDDTLLESIHIDRQMCITVYRAMCAKSSFDSVDNTYTKYVTGKMTIQQYMACCKVLEQLCIIKILDQYTVMVDKSSKVNLQDSVIFENLSK